MQLEREWEMPTPLWWDCREERCVDNLVSPWVYDVALFCDSISPEGKIRGMIEHKLEHSWDVVLAGRESYDPKIMPFSLTLGDQANMSHDCFRPLQAVLTGAISDRLTGVDHGQKGAELFETYGPEVPGKPMIVEAIKWHNKLRPPDNLSPLGKWVRDCDKLANWLHIDEWFGRLFKLNGQSRFKPYAIETLFRREVVDKRYLPTRDPMNEGVMVLSWLHDINFPSSLEFISRHGLVEKAIGMLEIHAQPEDREMVGRITDFARKVLVEKLKSD